MIQQQINGWHQLLKEVDMPRILDHLHKKAVGKSKIYRNPKYERIARETKQFLKDL